jgi:phospholipase C
MPTNSRRARLLVPLMLVAVAATAGLDLFAGDRAALGQEEAPSPLSLIRPPAAIQPAIQLPPGIHKIRHVIIVMQENRSFDNYFGTFPGAAGIPMRNGRPTVCIPDAFLGHCVRPFHDPHLIDGGGPHTQGAARLDIHAGRMSGFIRMARRGRLGHCIRNPDAPDCTGNGGVLGMRSVVGWHDAREIPNYWAYARHFVLQDHMFEGVRSWSLPAHFDMVSGWSASCPAPSQPMTCQTALGMPAGVTGHGLFARPTGAPFAWTDLTYLLHKYGVSWKYYVANGSQPDCASGAMFCPPRPQSALTPDIWNPLPGFQTVQQDGQLGNIQSSKNYFRDARTGTLPSVSWIVPNSANSEHPPASIAAGQRWVTRVVNAAMQSSDWRSTAIFVTWDDWGGFYDHVVPPSVGGQPLGLRVPGLVISPYAKTGYIDHQVLSTDSYLRFIEDVFLGGQRLDPATDGRPDARPFVAETAPGLGNLINDFNFHRPPRKPMLLPLHPKPGRASIPGT